jgi:hypothetical protein
MSAIAGVIGKVANDDAANDRQHVPVSLKMRAHGGSVACVSLGSHSYGIAPSAA